MIDTDQTSYGVSPAYQQVSDFQFGEAPSLTGVCNNAIDISVPYSMASRKLYAWLWAQNSGTNWWVKGSINFWRQQSALGSLPLSIGGGSFGAQSLVTVCTSNGQNVQDCLGVYVANQTGSQPSSLVLQPLYINGAFDRITFSVSDANSVSAIRALIACVSSGQ
jgi:hypothetical protein